MKNRDAGCGKLMTLAILGVEKEGREVRFGPGDQTVKNPMMKRDARLVKRSMIPST